jgi:CubicO group peptidase (beta-lactamase class C family)
MRLFRLSLLSVSRPALLLRFQRTAERMPMESVTRCPIASVSKHFVSAGAYLLQQKGALSVDAPLQSGVSQRRRYKLVSTIESLSVRQPVY